MYLVVKTCLGLYPFLVAARGLSIFVFPTELLYNCPLMLPLREEKKQGLQRMQR